MKRITFLILLICFHSLTSFSAEPGKRDKEIFDYPEQKGNCYGIFGSLLNKFSSFSYDRKAIEIGHLFKSYLAQASILDIPGTSLNRNWHVERPLGVVTSLLEKRGGPAPLKLVHSSGLTLNVTRIAPFTPMLEIRLPIAPAPLRKVYSDLKNERPFVDDLYIPLKERVFEEKGSVFYIPKDYEGTPRDAHSAISNDAEFVRAIDELVTPAWMYNLSRVTSSVVEESVGNLKKNIKSSSSWKEVNGSGRRENVSLPIPRKKQNGEYEFELSEISFVTQVDGPTKSDLGLISMFIGFSKNRPIIFIHSRMKGLYYVSKSEDSIFTLSNDEQKLQDFLDVIFHPEIALENKGMPFLKFESVEDFEPLDNFLRYQSRTGPL